MKNDIKQLVDSIFEKAPDTRKARELHEEMYTNLCDRYDELTRGGKSDDEAMRLIRSEIGDFTPIINSLVEESGNARGGDVKDSVSDTCGASDAADTEPYAKDDEKSDRDDHHKGAASSPSPSQRPRTQDTNRSGNGRKHMSPGAIAAIVVAAVLAFVLLVSLAVIAGLMAVKTTVNIAGFIGYSYPESDKYTLMTADEQQITGNIDSIDIGWFGGNVTVVAAGVDSITIVERSETDFDNGLCYRVENGKLYVRFSKPIRLWEFIRLSRLNKDVTIYVPSASDVLNYVEISSISADVNIDGGNTLGVTDLEIQSVSGNVNIERLMPLAVNEIEVETVSGQIMLTACYGEKITLKSVSGNICCMDECFFTYGDFSCVSGNVSYSGDLNNIDVEMVSGRILLDLATFSNIDIESVSGNIDICVGICDNITLELESVSSSVNFNGFGEVKRDGKRYIVGNGSRYISVSSVSSGVTFGPRPEN